MEPLRTTRAVPEDTPHIVYLCGYKNQHRAFRDAYARETAKGNIVVLPVGYYPLTEQEMRNPDNDYPSKQSNNLDALKLRKIELADSVLVLNVCGDIHNSCALEIAYAESKGKPIAYLEPCEAADEEE